MNDLLTFAVQAHDDLDRWNNFRTLRADLSANGAICQLSSSRVS